MTDDETPKRPNANYELSKPYNEREGEKLNFHYSREHRLANAPQSVRDLYNKENQTVKFSLLKPLVADKPRAMLFFSIIVLCVIIITVSLLGFLDNNHSLDGNKLMIKGTGFEDTTIIVLRKTVSNKNQSYSGAVDIAVSEVSGENGDYTVFYHRIFFTMEPDEEYRFIVPFNSPQLVMVIQTEKNALKIPLKVD